MVIESDVASTSALRWEGWDADRRARALLGTLGGGGDPRLLRLVADEGAEQVWCSLRSSSRDSAWVRRARACVPEGLLAASARAGLRFLVPGDDEWPRGLAALEPALVNEFGGVPLGLWARGGGDLARLAEGSVAVVGGRASTPYGDHAANELCHDLARAGRTIVSGGAYGIDAAGHRAALAAGGTSIAVLACGLDRSYPVAHAPLFAAVEQAGVLVSEHPVGETPTKRAFLARNRIIAALADATVIVEAAARSGARNTVAWAHACGRPVAAVPGPITAAMSVTPHRLIRDNLATLVASSQDVEALLAPMGQAPLLPSGGSARRLDAVPAHLMAVREVLPGRGGASLDEVAAATGLSIARCLASLGELDDLGLVATTADGGWRAVRP